MAGSVNKAIVIGNLGRDPEIRHNNAGERIATLSVATSDTWRDKVTGERKERTEWHRVVIFNDALAGVAEKFLQKGSTVYLEGALQTRKWTDSAGVERYTTEVVLQRYGGTLTLLGGRNDGGSYPPPADSPDDYGRTSSRDGGFDQDARGNPIPKQSFDLNDDIPF